ncbi:hypothetical protein RI129_002963 [Pyrocoelia pectoralis]|uniref:THAP-type domain-containing protein n=1 Tax=Pyrocoelia pectoralis TaxID=417401 RepID=A0AAN7VMY0_9COLE
MPGIYCTVEGCWDSKESKHRFPNSNIYPELFRKWLDLCNKKALFDLPPNLVYSNYRVCRLHFAEEDFGRNNRLLKTAYPKLRLPVLERSEVRISSSFGPHSFSLSVLCSLISSASVSSKSLSSPLLNN